MKNKKKWIIPIIVLVLIMMFVLIFFYIINKNVSSIENNKTPTTVFSPIGIPDPSGGYCKALGYENKIITEKDGSQYDICILPDGTECDSWAFYRGKCGQKWSYCDLGGYDIKNLTINEGWGADGSICINKITQKEIGNVFDLVNQEWTNQNKTTSN